MKPISKNKLLKHGQCCALGCINCPYSKPRVKGNTKLENSSNMENFNKNQDHSDWCIMCDNPSVCCTCPKSNDKN